MHDLARSRGIYPRHHVVEILVRHNNLPLSVHRHAGSLEGRRCCLQIQLHDTLERTRRTVAASSERPGTAGSFLPTVGTFRAKGSPTSTFRNRARYSGPMKVAAYQAPLLTAGSAEV